MSLRKDHAKHNEELCDQLIKIGNYPDWVVTSAFYSALHYVEHQLFPFTDPGTRIAYRKFDEYYIHVLKPLNPNMSKHKAKIWMCSSHLPGAGPYYRWLFDQSMNSRYRNYQVSHPVATKAREKLESLKKFITKG